MSHLKFTDKVFDRQVSLRDAYRILEAFVVQYHERGKSSTVALMTDINICGDVTSDPAQIYDFLCVSGDILHDQALIAAANVHGAG